MIIKVEIPSACFQALVMSIENPMSNWLISTMPQHSFLKIQTIKDIRVEMKGREHFFVRGEIYNEYTFSYTAKVICRLRIVGKTLRVSDLRLTTIPNIWSANFLFKNLVTIIENVCNEQLDKQLMGKIIMTRFDSMISLEITKDGFDRLRMRNVPKPARGNIGLLISQSNQGETSRHNTT